MAGFNISSLTSMLNMPDVDFSSVFSNTSIPNFSISELLQNGSSMISSGISSGTGKLGEKFSSGFTSIKGKLLSGESKIKIGASDDFEGIGISTLLTGELNMNDVASYDSVKYDLTGGSQPSIKNPADYIKQLSNKFKFNV